MTRENTNPTETDGEEIDNCPKCGAGAEHQSDIAMSAKVLARCQKCGFQFGVEP